VATPTAGYRFDEWTGDVGTIADVYAASTNITMNGDYSITAEFVRQYDLTTSSTAGGSVTDPGEGVFTYDEGTVVDLIAGAEEGYLFVEWTGDVGSIDDVYAASTNITMNGDYSITAEFVKQYDLTTSSTAGGTVTDPGEGVFTYDEGTVVDLVATPGAGYRFGVWTGDVGNVADVYDTSTNITMNGDYSITAEFVRQYDLTTSSTAGGSVTDPGEDTFTYDEGTVVDLVATPTAGYRFDEWTGDVGSIAVIYAASTNITMNGDYSITAEFVRQYDLTMAADPEAGGTATDLTNDSPYAEDAEVSIKAEAAEGYQFVNWTAPAGGFEDAGAAETIFTMPTQNITVTANFEEVPPLPDYPTATTQAATGVSLNSATPHMSYTTGNLSQVEVRFAYKKSTVSVWSYTDWVSKSGSGTHAELVTWLDSGTTYDFKAQLKYDDTLIEGTTFQFTTQESSTPPSTAGCCAATTAYGTPTAAQLDVLREFRDTVLLESNAGSQFVTLYYHQISPPVVDVISENEFLRTLVRELLLDPIVWAIEATSDIWSGLSTYTGLRV